MTKRTWVALVVVVVSSLVISGCGGGERAVMTPGDGALIEPPTQPSAAVVPYARDFGPLAQFLPPSGTTITYKFSGLLQAGNHGMRYRILYKNYINSTPGVMVLSVKGYNGDGDLVKDSEFRLWFKESNGYSYCIKRKKTFLDEVRPDEISTFTPGVLVGPSPASTKCNFTVNGPHPGSYSFVSRSLGTATVTVGGKSYQCLVTEISNFVVGDAGRVQIYWAPGVGPVRVDVTSGMVGLAQAAGLRLPWWLRLGGMDVESLQLAGR